MESEAELSDRPILRNYISSLPDYLVEGRIWPLIAEAPTLLLQLRGANRSWRALIDDSNEWNYLLLRYGPMNAAVVDEDLLAQKLDINRSRYRSWVNLWED